MILNDHTLENWASALAKIASDENKTDLYIEQTNLLIEVLKDQEDYFKILTIKENHQEQEKVNILNQTFASFGFDEYLMNAMRILVEQQAFINIRPILKKTRKKLQLINSIIYGVVWSTVELSDNQMLAIQKKLCTKFNKDVHLVNKLDPELIGGIQVSVNNYLFDGSILGTINKIKDQTLIKK